MEQYLKEERPIFLQIADRIEEGIVSGAYGEETQVPSINEFSMMYTINPATALKGITLLVNDGILYKKRGVGMFVAKGAREKLMDKRRAVFYEKYVELLVREAKQLHIEEAEVVEWIKRGFAQ